MPTRSPSSVRSAACPAVANPSPQRLAAAAAATAAPAFPSPIPALPLRPADLVQVRGPPASGKTLLLYRLVANCISASKAAVVLDTDAAFDVARVHALLPDSDASLLHVFRPTSSTQVAATLAHLPQYLAEHLPDATLGLLAIDSMGAFYWPDRFSNTNAVQHVMGALQSVRLTHRPVTVITDWDVNRGYKQLQPTHDVALSATGVAVVR